jgi:hypothetical protein
VKIYVAAAVEAHGKKKARAKGKTGWNSSLSPKLVEKLVWVAVISFCKCFHCQLVMRLMPYYCWNWPFWPPLIMWL